MKFKLVDDGSSKDLELNSSADCNITVPYATVEVPDNHPMGLTGATGSGSSTTGYDNEAYVALDTIVCPSGTYQAGSLAMKTGSSSTSYYVFKNNTDTLDLTWSFMGSTEAYSTGGAIRVSHNMTHATSANMGVNMSGETAKSALTFGVSENTGGVSDTAAVMVFGVNVSGSSSTFNFDGTSTSLLDEDHIYVNTSGPVTSDGTQEEGYITERGSIFKSIDDDSVEFSIANKVANAQVTLASADAADAAPNTVTLTMSEGESQTISGTDVTVSVVSIAATGSCDTGAGATPVCEVSGDASAYLVDSEGANMGDTLTASTAYEGDLSGLVALDSDVTAGTLISVGGPAVNSVTAGVEGDLALNAPGDTVVTEVGNTIVVAGYTAEDTMAAAAEFLAGLQ